MAETTIEWTRGANGEQGYTFNAWKICEPVGPGCDNCYARSLSKRAGWGDFGPHEPRQRTSEDYWKEPKRWNDKAAKEGTRPRVFCNSVSDWLDNKAPIEWLVDLLDLIRRMPHLDWLLLSKRIGNWLGRLEEARRYVMEDNFSVELIEWIDAWLDGDAPANVWIGATVVNQEEADRDIPKLLAVPALVRFLSMEPLLGPINLTDITDGHADSTIPRSYWEEGFDTDASPPAVGHNALTGERWQRFGDWRQRGLRIDWVIVGGESGPHARPMHPDWARALRDQCAAAGVPFHFKQWGEWAPPANLEDLRFLGDMMRSGKAIHVYGAGREHDGHFRKGDDHLLRVGKKAAGRLLDGRLHDDFPKVTA